ncbi:MAG: hypothetical protein ABI164_06370 [Acidobacteriaceae bacterium]
MPGIARIQQDFQRFQTIDVEAAKELKNIVDFFSRTGIRAIAAPFMIPDDRIEERLHHALLPPATEI